MRQEAQPTKRQTDRQTDRQTENKNAKVPPFCRMQNPTDKCGSRSEREKVLQEVESAKKSTRSFIHTCGWFLRHALRSSAKRPRAIPPDIAPGAPLPRFAPFVSHSSERERESERRRKTNSRVPIPAYPSNTQNPSTVSRPKGNEWTSLDKSKLIQVPLWDPDTSKRSWVQTQWCAGETPSLPALCLWAWLGVLPRPCQVGSAVVITNPRPKKSKSQNFQVPKLPGPQRNSHLFPTPPYPTPFLILWGRWTRDHLGPELREKSRIRTYGLNMTISTSSFSLKIWQIWVIYSPPPQKILWTKWQPLYFVAKRLYFATKNNPNSNHFTPYPMSQIEVL
jgi:hypothetical protein